MSRPAAEPIAAPVRISPSITPSADTYLPLEMPSQSDQRIAVGAGKMKGCTWNSRMQPSHSARTTTTDAITSSAGRIHRMAPDCPDDCISDGDAAGVEGAVTLMTPRPPPL